jgi:prevent-host-death family protein
MQRYPVLDITKDIHSLTTFRRRFGDFMKQLRKTKRPVVLTVKGKAAAVVQDAEAYQQLLDTAARVNAHEGIVKGWRIREQEECVRPGFLISSSPGMAYLVNITLRAERDLEHLYAEINAEALMPRGSSTRI